MSGSLWTKEDMNYLMLNAALAPAQELADYLNKSINSIRSKIKRLNIPKFDEVAVRRLKQLDAKKQAQAIKLLTPKAPTGESAMEHSFAEIALTLGMSEKAVSEAYASAIYKINKYLRENPDVRDEWTLSMMMDEDYSAWDYGVEHKRYDGKSHY